MADVPDEVAFSSPIGSDVLGTAWGFLQRYGFHVIFISMIMYGLYGKILEWAAAYQQRRSLAAAKGGF